MGHTYIYKGVNTLSRPHKVFHPKPFLVRDSVFHGWSNIKPEDVPYISVTYFVLVITVPPTNYRFRVSLVAGINSQDLDK